MLESMTGYGSAESVASGVKILVELRSVNNRFAEISVKLPRQLLPYELEVRELIRSRFQRGKISAYIQLQADDEQPITTTLNAEKTAAYRDLLNQLRDAAGIEVPLTLDNFLRFSDVFDSGSSALEHASELWDQVKAVALEAVEQLKLMRRREGKELLQDFASRLAEIEKTLALIRSLAGDNFEVVRKN